MLFSELETILNGSLTVFKDTAIRNFQTDTRMLSGISSDVFVALKGARRDGHDFIDEAVKRGVVNFIVEKNIPNPSINQFRVPDSLSALQRVAKYHRERFRYPVVGITGSNGKTIVKEWLSTLLSEKFHIIKSPASYNSQIGVPISVLKMGPAYEAGIFEAGISRTGEMETLAGIIQPDLGIFTTLGEAHDDGFDDRSAKLDEKLKLFKKARVVCQSDVPWFGRLSGAVPLGRLITWALEGKADYRVRWEKGRIIVNDIKFQTCLSDHASMQNIAHCIVAATTLGLKPAEVRRGLDLISAVPMRLELKKGVNGCYLLDDSYNNDIEGLKVAMDYLAGQPLHQKRTLILSDITHSRRPGEDLYEEISSLLKQRRYDRFIGIGEGLMKKKGLFPAHSRFYSDAACLLDDMPVFDHEMILIKGARNFQLEKLVNRLEEKNHGTILEVNFEALLFNLNVYRQLLEPETKMMVMVKANAYGSGLAEVANFLQHQRVDYLGVAYVDEAILLRKNGIRLPIMILNPYIESFDQFEWFDLQPEIYSLSHLKKFLREIKKPTPVHLKIDTGMHRLGFGKEDIPELIKILSREKELEVAGIFTHFSASEAPEHDAFTRRQAELFEEACEQIITQTGRRRPIKHACNSPAIVRWPQYHYDMVRLGIGLHGFDPAKTLNLKIVSRLKTTVSHVQNLKAGETVGYSRNGIVNKDSQVAVLPIGYEDGFLRAFGNGRARVRIDDRLHPTIGNICMDMCMVDVTGGNVMERDEAVIFDTGSSVNELAKAANTISYEILTNISSRVKRVFIFK